jgi:hypothetical protein
MRFVVPGLLPVITIELRAPKLTSAANCGYCRSFTKRQDLYEARLGWDRLHFCRSRVFSQEAQVEPRTDILPQTHSEGYSARRPKSRAQRAERERSVAIQRRLISSSGN